MLGCVSLPAENEIVRAYGSGVITPEVAVVTDGRMIRGLAINRRLFTYVSFPLKQISFLQPKPEQIRPRAN